MDRVKKIINASYAHSRGEYGEGVGVAVMDTGITAHPDFEHRISVFRDYIGYQKRLYDDNGHGTHVAGIIGGCGLMSKGVYSGIAPACHFISVKVLDRRGNGNTASVVEAIHWVVNHQEEYQIRIINISVGMIKTARNEEQIQLLKAVDYAWDCGIVVIAAAGNNGPGRGSVTIPGISRKVITVGCFDDTREQLNSQGLKPDYSGQGPTDCCIVKPELVEPGTNITSCSFKTNSYAKKSGTSMAAPIVSGAVALLLGKYPEFTPKDVKLRLHERAVDLGLPLHKQGWGMVDISRLL
jgi:serine protease AprX